jgi:FkbM family methyltransferase
MSNIANILIARMHGLKKYIARFFAAEGLRTSLRGLRKLRCALRYKNGRSWLMGKRIELTDPFWYSHCHHELFVDQIYKFEAKRQNPLIIDCGANIGLSVIYFKHLYPEAEVIAFEPDPKIFRVLQRNVGTFRLEGIVLHCKAVWNRVTTLSFLPDGGVGGRLVLEEGKKKSIQVQTVRLRGFLSQPVDFLKLDIEGAEYEVIKDICDVLEKVDHLFVEYHGAADETQTLHEILQMIQDAGFRYHLKEANPIQHPFVKEERNKLYDLQLNIFGFRE